MFFLEAVLPALDDRLTFNKIRKRGLLNSARVNLEFRAVLNARAFRSVLGTKYPLIFREWMVLFPMGILAKVF